MYENLVSNYEIVFEGMCDPVFYGRYYPMGRKEGPHRGELWDLFNYGRGLKRDKDPSGEQYDRFIGAYEGDLRTLLNCVMRDTRGRRRGVVVIPSSTCGAVNRVTELARQVLAGNPGPFVDMTGDFVRARSKRAAHDGGSRAIADNVATLEVRRSARLSQFDVILVMDDIVTSGNSFRAADKVLRRAGFAGAIINFAFSRTLPSDGVALLLDGARADARPSYHAESRPVDALVLDLDQTLVDDSVRNPAYEDWLRKAADCKSLERLDGIVSGGWHPPAPPRRRSEAEPYGVYDGVVDVLGLHMPMAVLSNRPFWETEVIAEGCLSRRLACVEDVGDLYPMKTFSFPTEEDGPYTTRYYKPSPKGVEEAAAYLRGVCVSAGGAGASTRVIGVGNTKEDMTAYNGAGIESALALWGVPDYLRGFAAENWGAALVFPTPGELARYCDGSACYFERAVRLDSEFGDQRRARDYYALAVRHGDHAEEAAYRLTCSISREGREKAIGLYEAAIELGDERYAATNLANRVDDPARAKELYERAIAAGEELYAPNNLANMIAEEDPARAEELYGMSIRSGDEFYAPRNLAAMISDRDPDRAADLFGVAAKSGNKESLSIDLAPLIKGGNLKAIDLYEREIISEDGTKANDLAELIVAFAPERAKGLYERAMAAGDERYATANLARLIEKGDPERAEELYERAIAAGDERVAANNLGVLLRYEDPERAEGLYRRAIAAGDEDCALNNLGELIATKDTDGARTLFERAIEAGDEVYATCNLAHTYAHCDPTKAEELYERSLRNGDEPEAKLGLSYLIRNAQPERSAELATQAMSADNFDRSLEYLSSVLALHDAGSAFELANHVAGFGYRGAWKAFSKARFGEEYDRGSDTLLFGRRAETGERIPWLVLGPAFGGILLLSKFVVKAMPFGGPLKTGWGDSSVREYLNGAFLEKGFDSERLDSMTSHPILHDRVFCLSGLEFDEYLGEAADGEARKAVELDTGKPTKWWLRPEGQSSLKAPCIDKDGEKVRSLAIAAQGIRPALIRKI